MTFKQMLITILLCSGATVFTRLVPFAAFSTRKKLPSFLDYLGKALPSAVFGMLMVYCLKDVNFLSVSDTLPEIIAIAAVIGLHLWKRSMMLSMVGGTIVYMLLLHFAIF